MLLKETKPFSPRWLKKIQTASPIGPVTVIVSDQGLVQVNFGESLAVSDAVTASPAPLFLELVLEEIEAYLCGSLHTFTIPIDWSVLRPFEQVVLKAAADIPYGKVVTYGELSTSIGRPGSARAAGGALGRNPMPLVIPCHRVIGTDRRLHGYSAPGGLTTKAWLLHLEGCRIVDQRVV
jgi:methylated-DNA-[protein]-cysteine S-methyltransferase